MLQMIAYAKNKENSEENNEDKTANGWRSSIIDNNFELLIFSNFSDDHNSGKFE